MKKIYIAFLLGFILAVSIYAQETPEKVTADAEELLAREQGKSDTNHQFLDDNVFGSFENRQKLNEYRSKFNEVNGRIYILKNQISVALKSRNPDMRLVSTRKRQLQTKVDDHDNLLAEYEKWVASIR